MATEHFKPRHNPSPEELRAFVNVLLDKDMPVYVQDPEIQNSLLFEQHEDEEVAPMFYFSEHRYLGNTIQLPDHDSAGDHAAANNPFTLQNGLVVTYGDINALSGDYFGLMTPISRGATLKDRIDRFQQSFDLLNVGEVGKQRAEAVIAKLKVLMAAVDDAIEHDPKAVHKAYQDHPLDIDALKQVTVAYKAGADFDTLALHNIDHFGPEARLTYNAGHALALQVAAQGDLQKAYAINAFADHFLQDSFAAGHVRVPRNALYSLDVKVDFSISFLKAIASNIMHDEDGNLGLNVQNPAGEKWKIYGDTKLFDPANSNNLRICTEAIKVSVQEVHDAYKLRKVIDESQFGAWKLAPILELVSSHPENHLPLLFVKSDGKIYKRNGNPGEGVLLDTVWDYVGFLLENVNMLEKQIQLQFQKIIGNNLGSLVGGLSNGQIAH
ncbi:hypothetical protein GGP41_010726 [Bipolaris sorokiniana]|uniref:Uncharacterized protein n=2 Tax=Cochliobolus sativus TaxID=45130 RepID=A0A8H5ZKH6_COCSA|nr:hypothetical protein GGP41_010726 [Bipolaris sorokiniana]